MQPQANPTPPEMEKGAVNLIQTGDVRQTIVVRQETDRRRETDNKCETGNVRQTIDGGQET